MIIANSSTCQLVFPLCATEKDDECKQMNVTIGATGTSDDNISTLSHIQYIIHPNVDRDTYQFRSRTVRQGGRFNCLM